MNEIEKYYNKFNEDKRLESRHGIVEFTVSMEYIKKYIKSKDAKIIDIGAGTGKYSITLANEGYDITAVELVKKNLSVLKQKSNKVKAYQGNALNLKKFKDESFDIVILFGPMYHLHTTEQKLQALAEAKRICKTGGIIFVAYLLADYAIIRHAFMDKTILTDMQNNKLTTNFNINSCEQDLYSYIRINDINELNKKANLTRIEIIAPDGATDYIRPYINKLTKQEFELYIKFQKQNASRPDLIGASSHVVDILCK